MKLVSNDEKIKNICFELLGKENIILIHYAGSLAYGNSNSKSDLDIIAITKKKIKLQNVSRCDNSFQLLCLKNLDFVSKIDLFVIDYENALKIHNISPNTSAYVRLFIDGTQEISKTLIYKNEETDYEYQQFSNINIEQKILPYYEHIVNYYSNLLADYPNKFRKHEYHIFRFLDNFEYYLKYGKYVVRSKGRHETIMLKYKVSSQSEYSFYRPALEDALSVLKAKVLDYKNKIK